MLAYDWQFRKVVKRDDMNGRIRIATRESQLALWQAEYVKVRLEDTHSGLVVELVPMTSKGDQVLDVPLTKVGGKGLFVKELEQALLEDRADIAVHSMKDVPMEFPEGLGLGVICEREDPTDAFVSNQYNSLQDLPAGSVVGTSSLRRECQLRQRRPDLEVKFLRGNVNTRLRKLDEGQYDAIILASAGLKRLGMGSVLKRAWHRKFPCRRAARVQWVLNGAMVILLCRSYCCPCTIMTLPIVFWLSGQ